MSKGYWVSAYRNVRDPAAMARYGELAAKAIAAAGGRFVIRGVPAEVRDNGIKERTVVVEFESLDVALATYASSEYRKALEALGDTVDRDLRIIEGVPQA